MIRSKRASKYHRLRQRYVALPMAVHCDSNDATEEPMQYLEASDGKLERIGKVIGDALAALVVLCVIILASGLILF